jgi:sugar lactone lactonase YvrE
MTVQLAPDIRGPLIRALSTRCIGLALAISFSVYSQSETKVGYTVIRAAAGSRLPAAIALLSLEDPPGVLISQAGVGAVEPISTGRVFVEGGVTETGIALANPFSQSTAVNLVLRDASGAEVSRQALSLRAGEHVSRFISQFFAGVGPGFAGSLTFESTQKLGAVALRFTRNALNNDIFSTLPVIDLGQTPASDPLVFPQIGAGDGYSTHLFLLNPSGQTIRGQVRLVADDGTDLVLRVLGTETSRFSYEIRPHGTYRAEISAASGLHTGYVVVSPDSGSSAPAGNAVFRFERAGSLTTEAGIGAATPTSSARVFVDNIGTYTGLAIANSGARDADVAFTLLARDGTQLEATTRTLAPRNHTALFAHDLFPDFGATFSGVMEISSNTAVSVLALKLTTNVREDLVLTALPVADLDHPTTAPFLVLPQIAAGGRFSTRIMFLNSERTEGIAGSLRMFQSNGDPMPLAFGSRTLSEWRYEISQAGARQCFPGGPANAASIVLLDRAASRAASEFAVNVGNTSAMNLLVLDTSGNARDDLALQYRSLSSDVATVDEAGRITGKRPGFSTLTISYEDVLTTATISVVSVSSGTTGYTVTGIAQDLARRLYMAATQDNTILVSSGSGQAPRVYAGIRGTAGFRNAARLDSLFRNPAFIAYDQGRGTMYVSDGANHSVRVLEPGADGTVQTLAGTGESGSSDGAAATSTFSNPQGIALDTRGRLWIADAGSHTIRRIDIKTRKVETIAGKAGVPGSADGKGTAARFNTPLGIAFESEPLGAQLERERAGGPPPPIRMIVADSENGILRRVYESGEVETLRETAHTSGASRSALTAAENLPALRFSTPYGVAFDAFGTLYVTEPKNARIRAILRNGTVVPVAEAGTFKAPTGIGALYTGGLVMADRGTSTREVGYGQPEISSVSPSRISTKGGERITIRGSNFAPDSIVVIGGLLSTTTEVRDTRTISFVAPALASGLTTLTVQNRAGLAQGPVHVEPASLDSLPPGYITTVAGGGTFVGDGLPALSATLGAPNQTAVDASGNIVFSDRKNHRVRRVSVGSGIITTIAGTGDSGFSGDDGPATAARLNAPEGIAIDRQGNILVADTANNRIRRIEADDGTIATVAGNGDFGYSGDGAAALKAALANPQQLAVDELGDLYIADTGNSAVRKVTAATGSISTIAGTGLPGFSGDGGAANAAKLAYLESLALDGAGNLFIADTENNRIRAVKLSSGVITTVAGTGESGFSGDDGRATAAKLDHPRAIAFDARGDCLVADTANNRIRRIDSRTGIITTLAGDGVFGASGDGGVPALARLGHPQGIAFDASANLLIADTVNRRIRMIGASSGIITAVAGTAIPTGFGDNGPAVGAHFEWGQGLAFAPGGDLFVADAQSSRVRRIDLRRTTITTAAGTGDLGSAGDGGAATSAQLGFPRGLAVDALGNLFIADFSLHRVRRVDGRSGVITTVAGTGVAGFSGDNGLATAAQLYRPQGLALDEKGNLFISDMSNERIRRVDGVTGVIRTIAGTGRSGFSGDNGPALSARLHWPDGVAVDKAGNVYVADQFNYRVRKIDTVTGIITTVAGNGTISPGANGLATAVGLSHPSTVGFDQEGNLLIVDGHHISRVYSDGFLEGIAGVADAPLGDEGPARAAGLADPWGVAVDAAGNVFVADRDHHRVRAIRGPVARTVDRLAALVMLLRGGVVAAASPSSDGPQPASRKGASSRCRTLQERLREALLRMDTGSLIPSDPTPVADEPGVSFTIEMSKGTYLRGDSVRVASIRLRNSGTSAVPVAMRLSLLPADEEAVLDIAYFEAALQAGLDINLGSSTIFDVIPGHLPSGVWEFRTRIESLSTGALLHEAKQAFTAR